MKSVVVLINNVTRQYCALSIAVEELICIERSLLRTQLLPTRYRAVDLQLKLINYIGSEKHNNNYNIVVKKKKNKRGNRESPSSGRFSQIDKVSHLQ